MDDFFGIFIAILPPFVLLGIGAVARRLKWLRSEADASLSMVTIRILYPCFILHHILSSKITLDASTFGFPALGFSSILIGFAIAWVISRIFGLEKHEASTFRFCAGIFNYGFIAIPVAVALFDDEIVVYIILFNLGVEIAIWTIGIFVLTGEKLNLRGFLNPPAITIVFALSFQQVIGSNILPVFIWEVIIALGNCSIPIGLILIGASFYELSGEFKFSRLFRVEVSSLLVRNVIFPMMAIICLYFQFLPTNMPWVQEILLIQSAMPAGIFAVVIVGNYGGDKLTALRTIPVTMIAGIVTLPFWVFLGLQIIE